MLFYYLTFLAEISDSELAKEAKKQASPISLNTIIMFGLFMVVFFIIMRSTARRSAKSRGKSGRGPKDIVKKELKENPYHTIDRLQQLMAALADMSREINGQIDTRTAKLEILLGHADRKISEYHELLNKYNKLQSSIISSQQQLEADNEKVAKADISTKINDNQIHQSQSKSYPDPTEPTPEPQSIDFRVTDDSDGNEVEIKDNNVEATDSSKILALAQSGLPLADISRLTGRPSGEVELILNLSGFKSRK